MKKLTQDTKFVVCGHEELKTLGWKLQPAYGWCYYHDNFPGNYITYTMIEKYQGKTLTITSCVQEHWYNVKEDRDRWAWPVATFLMLPTVIHICEEGMTPIDGWFICKYCGSNLKEIK